MSKEIVRVLRVIEYIGPRDWVEQTVTRSIQGEYRVDGNAGDKIIRAATVTPFPEVFGQLPKSREEMLLTDVPLRVAGKDDLTRHSDIDR